MKTLFLILLVGFKLTFSDDANTTYGPTHETTRQTGTGNSAPSGSIPANPPIQCGTATNRFTGSQTDYSAFICNSFGSCAIAAAIFPFVGLPLLATYGMVTYPTQYLVFGKRDIDPYSENRINQGLTFGLGPDYEFNSSIGISFSSDYYLGFKAKNRQVYGISVGANYSLDNIYKDFTRDVYVNDAKVGTLTDETSFHQSYGFPLLLDWKYLPDRFEGIEYEVGLGATYFHDYVEADRHYSYKENVVPEAFSDNTWKPTLMMRLGRKMYKHYMPMIQYNLYYNNPNHNVSVPAENSLFTNQFFWVWNLKM